MMSPTIEDKIMETLQLIQMLYHQESGIRRQAALVVGMVEETAALGALEQRLREEPDSNIKTVIMWAGNRVQQATRRKFSTIEAIFDHFQINHKLAPGIDVEEADFLPIQPTDTDISIKIKHLLNSSDMKRQKYTALELRDINNPQALPYLALAFYRNENLEMNALIEQAGKALYWSINYAAMANNGRLKLEIEKRRREGMYPTRISSPQASANPNKVQQESVPNILSHALQLRQKRNR
jgi:hypothetical protein